MNFGIKRSWRYTILLKIVYITMEEIMFSRWETYPRTFVCPSLQFVPKTVVHIPYPCKHASLRTTYSPPMSLALFPFLAGDPTVFGNMNPPPEAKEAVIAVVNGTQQHGYAPSVGYEASRQAVADLYNHPDAPLTAQVRRRWIDRWGQRGGCGEQPKWGYCI